VLNVKGNSKLPHEDSQLWGEIFLFILRQDNFSSVPHYWLMSPASPVRFVISRIR